MKNSELDQGLHARNIDLTWGAVVVKEGSLEVEIINIVSKLC